MTASKPGSILTVAGGSTVRNNLKIVIMMVYVIDLIACFFEIGFFEI